MNPMYNLDHLQAITHVAGVLGAALGDTAAVNRPASSTTWHYDPTGKEIATLSSTSYDGVTFAPDGSITGGTLAHISALPNNGPKRSTTTIGFGANGKPLTALITQHNYNSEGDYQHTQMDLSGATWNNALAISKGEVNLTTTDALTGLKKHEGSLRFEKETLQTGRIQHYGPADGTMAPGATLVQTGATGLSYGLTKFLGTTMVGGQYDMYHLPQAGGQNAVNVLVSPLGQTQSMAIENTDVTGKVAGNVQADFSGVQFNARNELHTGSVAYTAKDVQGALLSQSTVAYNNTLPTLATTLVYKKAQLQGKLVVDYSAAQFNNDNQVVNSSKRVDVHSGAGQLLSSTFVIYDQYGNPVKKMKAAPGAPPPQAPPLKAPPPSGFGGEPPQVPPPPPHRLQVGDANELNERFKDTYRPDGTLEMKRITDLDNNNKPTSIYILLYATDGQTIIRSHEINLSKLQYDAASRKMVGYVSMHTYIWQNMNPTTLVASSIIQY